MTASPDTSRSLRGAAAAVRFLRDTLEKEGEVIKAEQTPEGGWVVEVEVIEASEYMKKIGVPKPVYDKNIYRVVLNAGGEVAGYERRAAKPSGAAPTPEA